MTQILGEQTWQDLQHMRRAIALAKNTPELPFGAVIQMVVFGTSIRFLQQRSGRQIDVLAEEIVHRNSGWQCTIVGSVLQEEGNRLFARGTVHICFSPPRSQRMTGGQSFRFMALQRSEQ